jgi:hypothetical protein
MNIVYTPVRGVLKPSWRREYREPVHWIAESIVDQFNSYVCDKVLGASHDDCCDSCSFSEMDGARLHTGYLFYIERTTSNPC